MIKLLVTALLVTFVAGLPQQRRCPVYRCMACPDGYDLDENGCESCTCKEVKRAVCSPVLCKIYCENGFATGPDGCPICACA
uniref:DEC-2 n=1 Tax=Lymnaea stagnalis TaxID=6523 RepID=Q75R51_LYMST|nr:DEC-2 [Lymnaea stagnalis]